MIYGKALTAKTATRVTGITVVRVLAAPWLLLLVVLLFPQLTHLGQSSDDRSRIPSVPMSDEEYNKRLNDMIRLPEPE